MPTKTLLNSWSSQRSWTIQ